MPIKKQPKAPRRKTVTFNIDFDGTPDKPLSALAYLFDRQGHFKSSSPLKNGKVRFRIDNRQLKGARLFLGPEFPAERYGDKPPTLLTMTRLQAFEPTWRFEPDRDAYDLKPIPESLWKWWWWCICRVRGRVIKTVDTGGATYELPVCEARVHICEVDPLLLMIPRLPDRIIRRLRDEFIKVLTEPPLPFPPDPGPLRPDLPKRVSEVELRQAQLAKTQLMVGPHLRKTMAAISPQPEPPSMQGKTVTRTATYESRADLRRPLSFAKLSPQPEPPDLELRMQDLSVLPAKSRLALHANNINSLRSALLDHAAMLKPYICIWPWLWPYFLRCDEVAVVMTDANGRFDASVSYPCFGDRPDLYFWVEFPIDGVFETVYRPRIQCHTYWNFDCSHEVTIRITDDRVPGCWEDPEVIGKKIVVKSIGNRVSMSEINRASIPAEEAKEGTGKAGELTRGIFPEWSTKEVAFGATLEPRVDFGNGLSDAGITHYLWSYRPLGSTDASDWIPIDAVLKRYYRVTTPPGAPVRYQSVRVGPDADGLFVIEPALPPDGEGWVVLNEHHDLASARFNTRSLETAEQSGKFELKLELFTKTGGSVQRVDLTAESVELYETTGTAPFTADEILTVAPTIDRKIEEPVGGDDHLVAYRLVLHIDNRLCYGTIDDPVIDGIGAGACGFLEYDPAAMPLPSVQIAFKASHPGDFAAFNFVTTRVATDLPSGSAHELVEAAGVNGFSRTGDTFAKSIPVGTLLGEGVPSGDPICAGAAFAESLYVYALIINGYRRLRELDGPRSTIEDPTQIDVRAFAIVAEEPAP